MRQHFPFACMFCLATFAQAHAAPPTPHSFASMQSAQISQAHSDTASDRAHATVRHDLTTKQIAERIHKITEAITNLENEMLATGKTDLATSDAGEWTIVLEEKASTDPSHE